METGKSKTKAHLALFTANVIYGLNYIVAKDIMPVYLEPVVIIFLRLSGAGLFFWVLHLVMPTGEAIEKRDFGRLALCAFFGIALNQVMFFEGLNLTTPINAAIIMVVVPILVMALSHLILHERITGYKTLGLVLGSAGATYLILSGGSVSLQKGNIIGNLLVFINAASYGLYLVLVKPLSLKYKPFTILKWLFLFGFIYIQPYSVVKVLESDWTAIPLSIWFNILYVVGATTITAYFLYYYALKQLSPVTTSAYIYLQPIMAAILALVLGKDRLTFGMLLSALLIFTGVYLVNRRR